MFCASISTQLYMLLGISVLLLLVTVPQNAEIEGLGAIHAKTCSQD
jgi:hypothetical protein